MWEVRNEAISVLGVGIISPMKNLVGTATGQKFIVSEALQKNDIVMEVLYKNYYETIENGYVVVYEDGMEEDDLEISKKRRQFLEVIEAIQQFM